MLADVIVGAAERPAVIDAGAETVPFPHYWNRAVGAGRAAEGLRADWLEHLDLAATECGFENVRFHGLFHDDMFVLTERAGSHVLNFHYVDAVFDRLLERGVRPFVEFGFSPRVLARATETVFWWKGHGAPPSDLDAWCALVVASLQHWIDRYGRTEVVRWYFEVWNEPNLRPFFDGDRSEYYKLYEATARAIKSVDDRFRVGGPATSNFVPDARFDGERENIALHTDAEPEVLDGLTWRPVWVEHFLAWCVERKIPLDFLSCHPYPTDWALDEHGQGRKLTRGVDATPTDLRLLRKIVTESARPELEIHITEWSSSSSSRDHTHDSLPAATFVVRSILHSVGLVDSMAYWTFTDIFEEQGAGHELFHGGFGLVTLPGIVKPTFHAYRMLAGLGEGLLHADNELTVTRSAEELVAIAYHYPPEESRSVPASFDDRSGADETESMGERRPFSATFSGLVPGATAQIEILDRSHGNAVAAWRRMGSPGVTTREQENLLRDAARATLIRELRVGEDGGLHLALSLEPWSVVQLRAPLAPRKDPE